MEQDYWSLEDILADTQRVPCIFNQDAPNLGYLQSNEEEDIKALARLELPFWLVECLAQEGMVSLSIPKAYGPRVRAALDANPTSVQLRNQNTNWYALGMRLAKLIGSDDQGRNEFLEMLAKAYGGRMAHIFQQTQQAKKEEASVSSASAMLSDGPALGMAAGSGLSPEVAEFLQGLDETERQLLNARRDM